MDAITQTVQNLECPMCCSKIFETKEELITHLSQLITEINCPICKQTYQSLQGLVHHLNTDICHSPDDLFDEDSQSSIATHSSTATKDFNEPQKVERETNTTDSLLAVESKSVDSIVENGDVSNMYAELLKSDWHPQEVRLVQENGENHYIFLTSTEVGLDSDTVVTKNNDGTISLTTLEDMKVEDTDPQMSDEKTQTDNEDAGDEIYTCNTCGISFTSVLEHIQNFHNDQEVVVEGPVDESPLEYEASVNQQHAPKRVITETGNIVDATDQVPVKKVSAVKVKQEPDTQKRTNSKRYIKVEKLCTSEVRKINKIDYKNGAVCHKVVMQSIKGSTSKVFHCVKCNLYVPTLAEFKSHPCKILKYKCLQCPVSYNNPKSLCAHMKVHKVVDDEIRDPVKFICEICNTTFQTGKSLKLHKRMHDPLKMSKPLEGPVTKEGIPKNKDMFLCSVCDKLIPIDYRTIHQNSHHKDNDKLNCDVCNKKFTTPEFLEMHTNVHNMDRVTLNNPDKELPYSCLYCHRKFSRPHEKVKHERIHTGEKPHSCEICGKSFRVSYCLTLHMRTHTGARPYACPHCPKRFKAHSVYNHHILTHSEVRAYKCPFCSKAFKTSVQLAGHKNSHTKPFACQQCNRPFASLYAVRVHTETHSRHNNLKFSCSECGASYARASALKDHTKQAHGTENNYTLQAHKQNFKPEWTIKGDDNQSVSTDESQCLLTIKDSVPINNEAWLNCT